LNGSVGRGFRFILSIAGFVVLWGLVAGLLQPRNLPTPWAVLGFIGTDLVHGDMLFNIAMTLWRAGVAFFVAMAIGCGLGFLFGRSQAADEAFMPWVLVLMNTPVLVIAALCYIWFGLNDASAILAVFLSKFPNNTIILRDGVRSFDPGLDDIGVIYRFSLLTRFRQIWLPQAMPFVIAATRSGIGIVWKIVLVVEFFGLSNGVGFAISRYFSVFAIKEIIGYSVAFSFVMLAVELLILQPLDNHARRWRLAAS
jgi:NitT/TauT family transport system permease protein